MSAEPVRIPLRRRDGTVRAYALVDEQDAGLAEHRWHLGDRYVERNTPDSRTKIRLHREILGLTPGDGLEGDHFNGDRLDNRRSNLRVVVHKQQMQNVAAQADRSSRYRGVGWHKRSGRWQAYVNIAGTMTHLGLFDDEEAAATAAAAGRAQRMEFVNEARSVAPTTRGAHDGE